VLQQFEERHADAHRFRRKAVHLDIARIEQHHALLGIDHAKPMRHAVERRFVQREQLPELACLGTASRSVAGCVHHSLRPAFPRSWIGRLRTKARIPG
jgi:hypothetical protein